MKHYEFWFIVGSQTLYGEDVLTTVANRAGGNGAEAVRRCRIRSNTRSQLNPAPRSRRS